MKRMPGGMKVSVKDTDADTLYRTTEIQVGGRRLRTPLKALNLHQYARVPLPVGGTAVNEVFRAVNVKHLGKAMTDMDAHTSLLNPIRLGTDAGRAHDAVSVVLLELDEITLDADKIAYVENMAYMGDIVAVPMVDALHRAADPKKAFRDYVNFAKRFIDEVHKLNHKPILGTMPPLPWLLTRDLADAYMDAGVDGFLFDFAGRTPSAAESSGLRHLLKRLKEEDKLESTLFYAVNANAGRAAAKPLGPGMVSAKDILSFGFNVDVLGLKHIGLRGPKEMYDKLEANGPIVRLFDRSAYAYRDAVPADAPALLPTDTRVPLRLFDHQESWDRGRAIANMEQHAREAEHLRTVIREHRVRKYLGGKKALESSDMDLFLDARRDLKRGQTSLGKSDWGL